MTHLVSVIIPAYNAAHMIDRTLDSVRAQTWRDLEIVVVDDGSTDGTAEHVRRHAQEDARVRLITQQNGGVARARNLGIAESKGDLIAPVDADDLWRPDKIARQVEALDAGGPEIGLVYCWFAVIDDQDRIMSYGDRSRDEGDVLRRMCLGNLVGNGSAPLMRREAVLAGGGYDPELKAQGAQGCEDLKLYIAIAERYRFAVVPDFLLGYRWTAENMSSDGRQMLRSFDLVMEPLRARYPDFAPDFQQGRIYMLEWLLQRALNYGRLAAARPLFVQLRQHRPSAAWALLARTPRQFVKAKLQRSLDRERPNYLDKPL